MIITEAVRDSLKARAKKEAGEYYGKASTEAFNQLVESAKREQPTGGTAKDVWCAYLAVDSKLHRAKDDFLAARYKELLAWAADAPEPRLVKPMPPAPNRAPKGPFAQWGPDSWGKQYASRAEVEAYDKAAKEHLEAFEESLPLHLRKRSPLPGRTVKERSPLIHH